MKKTILATLLLSSTLILGACGHETKNTATTEHSVSSKTTKKPSSTSSSNQSKSQSVNSTSSKSDNNPVKYQFPADMQGTWYHYDSDTDSFYTNKINGNIYTYDEGPDIKGSNPVYIAKSRSQKDLDAAMPEHAKNQIAERKKWYVANVGPMDSNRFSANEKVSIGINLTGWYQTAGGGITLYETTEKVNNQTMKVLSTSYGAGMWNPDHYYRTKALAKKLANQTFDSDVFN